MINYENKTIKPTCLRCFRKNIPRTIFLLPNSFNSLIERTNEKKNFFSDIFLLYENQDLIPYVKNGKFVNWAYSFNEKLVCKNFHYITIDKVNDSGGVEIRFFKNQINKLTPLKNGVGRKISCSDIFKISLFQNYLFIIIQKREKFFFSISFLGIFKKEYIFDFDKNTVLRTIEMPTNYDFLNRTASENCYRQNKILEILTKV